MSHAIRMSQEQLEAHQARISRRHIAEALPLAKPAAPKRSKHGNVRTVVDGIKFDSKHEARCWQALKLREKAGEIQHLQRQVSFPLEVAGKRVQRWRCDFWYWEPSDKQRRDGWEWQVVVADAKSAHTASLPAWKRTRVLFEALYGITVVELL